MTARIVVRAASGAPPRGSSPRQADRAYERSEKRREADGPQGRGAQNLQAGP